MHRRSDATPSPHVRATAAEAERELTRFDVELGVGRSRNAGEIAANTRTMRVALELAEDLSVEVMLRLHAVLMEPHRRHIRRAPL